MRTLIEIVEEAKDGGHPDHDELRYAVCALSALKFFDYKALMNLCKGEKEGKKKILSYSAEYQYNQAFNRTKAAMNKSPKEWLGESNDPDSPHVQERRKKANKIFDKFVEKSKHAQSG